MARVPLSVSCRIRFVAPYPQVPRLLSLGRWLPLPLSHWLAAPSTTGPSQLAPRPPADHQAMRARRARRSRAKGPPVLGRRRRGPSAPGAFRLAQTMMPVAPSPTPERPPRRTLAAWRPAIVASPGSQRRATARPVAATRAVAPCSRGKPVLHRARAEAAAAWRRQAATACAAPRPARRPRCARRMAAVARPPSRAPETVTAAPAPCTRAASRACGKR